MKLKIGMLDHINNTSRNTVFLGICRCAFKSPGPWDKFDIDCKFGKGDQLFILSADVDILG